MGWKPTIEMLPHIKKFVAFARTPKFLRMQNPAIFFLWALKHHFVWNILALSRNVQSANLGPPEQTLEVIDTTEVDYYGRVSALVKIEGNLSFTAQRKRLVGKLLTVFCEELRDWRLHVQYNYI